AAAAARPHGSGQGHCLARRQSRRRTLPPGVLPGAGGHPLGRWRAVPGGRPPGAGQRPAGLRVEIAGKRGRG
nr:hypothetical protein [Tanacetum cinerariifolium]